MTSTSGSDDGASSLTPTEIIFEYVCPTLGMIMANVMFAAPLQDLQTAVSIGLGLGDLNPTPFAFMLGNCIGWTTYGVITNVSSVVNNEVKSLLKYFVCFLFLFY